MSSYSESITWVTVDEEMPPLELTVMLSVPANGYNDAVWLGWWTGEDWYFIDGMIVEDREQTGPKVEAWARMPTGMLG